MMKIATLITTTTALVALAGAANAADQTMICKNPHREYAVTYSEFAITIDLDVGTGPFVTKIDPAKTKWNKGKPIVEILGSGDEPRRLIDFSRMQIKFYFDGNDDKDADQIDDCMSQKDHKALNAETAPKPSADDLASVKAEIKARCTAQWKGKDNQYSMIAFCIERELEALAKIADF